MCNAPQNALCYDYTFDADDDDDHHDDDDDCVLDDADRCSFVNNGK